jgi:hypothetical protein
MVMAYGWNPHSVIPNPNHPRGFFDDCSRRIDVIMIMMWAFLVSIFWEERFHLALLKQLTTAPSDRKHVTTPTRYRPPTDCFRTAIRVSFQHKLKKEVTEELLDGAFREQRQTPKAPISTEMKGFPPKFAALPSPVDSSGLGGEARSIKEWKPSNPQNHAPRTLNFHTT